MIPILYDANETQFNHNGLGRLSDAIYAKADRGLNGEDEVTIMYPESGIHRADLETSRIILAKPADNKPVQPYRIYKITKQSQGRVEVKAEHFGYQLNYQVCMPFTANTCAAAMSGLKFYAVGDCPFTFVTDISASGDYVQDKPEPIRARLMGSSGSVLSVYGGELEFDWYTVRLKSRIGVDSGVTLRYGKDIIDLRQENAIDKVYTAILPYVSSDEGGLITLPEKILIADVAANYPFVRVMAVDMADEFGEDEPKTVAALRQKGQTYLQTHNVGIPDIGLTVSFVPLWQTEEYKHIAALQRVGLGDTITVDFVKLDILMQAKVTHTTYNILEERYDSIDIGQPQATVSSIIAGQGRKIEQTMTSTMEKAIQHATDLITGGLGGYVVLKRNAQGKPEEILVMDTDDISTAVNVWRWNKNGWGHSMHGYDGPYEMAATLDNGFIADFIKTGTLDAANVNVINLNASNINTGTLNASRISVVNLSASSINSGTLNCSNITVTNLSATSITTGTLDCGKFSVSNFSANYIKAGTMSCDRLSGGTLNFQNITVQNLRADDIKSGTLNCSNLTVTNLSASSITSGTLNCSRVTVTNLSASSITTGTMSGNRISGGTISGCVVNANLGLFTTWIKGEGNENSAQMIQLSGNDVDIYTGSSGSLGWCNVFANNIMLRANKKVELLATDIWLEGTVHDSSDRRIKHDIEDISEAYEDLFFSLKPVQYRFNSDNSKHIGIIAQDLEQQMEQNGIETDNHGMFVKEPKTDENGSLDYKYGVGYSEFIMLNTYMIQKLFKRIELLECMLREKGENRT